MSGRYRFVYLRTCGCVLSEKAQKELTLPTCALCGVAYSSEDVVAIYPEGQELEAARARMEERRAAVASKVALCVPFGQHFSKFEYQTNLTIY